MLVLDRPRHDQIIKEVREAGARIKLISDGDVGGAIEVAKLGAPVDVLFGIGGTPEGDQIRTLANCMNPDIQGHHTTCYSARIRSGPSYKRFLAIMLLQASLPWTNICCLCQLIDHFL